MFEELGLENDIEHHIADVRDLETIRSIILDFKPDFLFHLAAQPIVSLSYSDPLDTISSNVMGTANVLEALRSVEHHCNAVIVTSDKCYENVEWVWGYKETDHMGVKISTVVPKELLKLFSTLTNSHFSKTQTVKCV